jgi:hypothetical protein
MLFPGLVMLLVWRLAVWSDFWIITLSKGVIWATNFMLEICRFLLLTTA